MVYHIIIDSFIGPYSISKGIIRRELDKYKGKHVDVLISSPGGSVTEAFDIRTQFKEHGDVTAYLAGGVASAATIVAMGAKRIVMSKYSMFLVHKCMNFIDAWGAYNADQMQALIEELTANKKENDKIDVLLAEMYAAKCNKSIPEILPVLKEGRWLMPSEALEYGFVDEVSDTFGKESKIDASPDMISKLNFLGIPTLGLPDPVKQDNPESKENITEVPAPDKINTSKTHKSKMDQKKFATVESLLKMDTIVPDNDGYVSVTSEQFATIDSHMASLESDVTAKKAQIEKMEAEIKDLHAQVENLKQGPGDTTDDVKTNGGTDSLSNDKIDEYVNEICK